MCVCVLGVGVGVGGVGLNRIQNQKFGKKETMALHVREKHL